MSKIHRLGAALVCITLVAGACSNDDDDTKEAATDTGAAGFTVTLTEDGIEVPAEVKGGVVEVTLVNETGNPEADANFTQVAKGTTEEELIEAVQSAVSGGEIPDTMQSIAGVVLGDGETEGTYSITLPAGEYFVWFTPPPAEEGEGGEEPDVEAESVQTDETTSTTEGDGDVTTTTGEEAETGSDEGEGDGEAGNLTDEPEQEVRATALTVTEGDGGELPETDGTFTADDYSFEVDVAAGDTYTFRNAGPKELHHGVIFNLGDLDPTTVEENFKAFLESEEDMPPPFDVLDQEQVFAGGSGVFSPDLAGTFPTKLEAGTTYAVVCFLSDRAGGPPHAMQYDMWKVFQVS